MCRIPHDHATEVPDLRAQRAPVGFAKNDELIATKATGQLSVEKGGSEMCCNTDQSSVTGFVAATGKSYLCDDTTTDPLYIEGAPGARSSLTVALLVGDVAGHGPVEAAVGVALRAAWRALVLTGHSPDDLLDGLDKVLTRERESEELFATVCCCSSGVPITETNTLA